MEGDRAGRLTTRAVTAALLLGAAFLLAGLLRGLPPGAAVARPGELLRVDGPALVGVGVLLLVLAPIARLIGLGAGFCQAGQRGPLAATAGMLLLLALSFVAASAREW